MPGAVLHTAYLPERMKRNFSVGLDARMLELVRDQRTGYSPGAVDPRIGDLVSDARAAFAVGLIAFLPTWAKP